MKKARAWLDQRGVAYAFHDYKSAGVERGTLERWARETGWETLLNRAGTTFRKLADKDKEGLTEKKAIALMLAQPSMIKRPVLDIGGKLLVGFQAEQYAKAFGGSVPIRSSQLSRHPDAARSGRGNLSPQCGFGLEPKGAAAHDTSFRSKGSDRTDADA